MHLHAGTLTARRMPADAPLAPGESRTIRRPRRCQCIFDGKSWGAIHVARPVPLAVERRRTENPGGGHGTNNCSRASAQPAADHRVDAERASHRRPFCHRASLVRSGGQYSYACADRPCLTHRLSKATELKQISGTRRRQPRCHEMKDGDPIRRNRALFMKASNRDMVAAVLDQRSKLDHARNRMRKASRARALWPQFMRQLIGMSKRAPNSRDALSPAERSVTRRPVILLLANGRFGDYRAFMKRRFGRASG